MEYDSAAMRKINGRLDHIVDATFKAGLEFVRDSWGVEILTSYTYPKLNHKLVWGTKTGRVCAGGAVLLIKQPPCPPKRTDVLGSKAFESQCREAICTALGVDIDFVNGFIDAYDLDDYARDAIKQYNRSTSAPIRNWWEHSSGYNAGNEAGYRLVDRIQKNKK